MKRLKIIGFIAVILLTASLYGYKEFTRKKSNLKYIKSDKQMTASELLQDFENNENEANTRYLDKIIRINGIVKAVIKNRNRVHFVIIGEKNSMSSIRCNIDSTGQEGYREIRIGDQVIIKGACTGYIPDMLLGSEVILNRSVIITQMEATKYE